MITHAKPPRRRRKATPEPRPRIIQTIVTAPRKKRRGFVDPEPDAETPEAVREFFRRMVRPR